MKTRKILYEVSCSCGKSFEKAFAVQKGTEAISSEAQAFCPHCGEYVTVKVQGKLAPDAELLRKIEAQKKITGD